MQAKSLLIEFKDFSRVVISPVTSTYVTNTSSPDCSVITSHSQ